MVGAGTSTPSDERSGEGARGKGRQRPPPSSPPAGERKGAGGEGEAAPSPFRSPCGRGRGPGEGEAAPSPFRSPCGRGRGPGEGEGAPSPFLAPSGGEEGGWGEGEGRQPCAAVPALQPVHPCSIHQDAGQRPALPARNYCVSGFRRS